MTQARELRGQTKLSPVSLSDAKKWLRLLEDDESENALVLGLLSAVTDYIETFLNKSVSLTVFVLELTEFTDVVFQKYPFHSIVKIEYLNTAGVTTVLSPENYEVSLLSCEDAILEFLTKPETYSRADGSKKANTVSIRFRCGYEEQACPASIKIAIRLLVCKWYDNREDGKKEKLTAVDNILSPLRNVNF